MGEYDKNKVELLARIRSLAELDIVELRKAIMDVMSSTGSWITQDEIRSVIGSEKFDEMMGVVKEEAANRFPYGYATDEQTDAARAANVKKTQFFFVKREDGTYDLSSTNNLFEPDAYVLKDVKINGIDKEKFCKPLSDALKRHGESVNIHNNGVLDGTGIREVIDAASREFDKMFFQKMREDNYRELLEKMDKLPFANEGKAKETLLELMNATQVFLNQETTKVFLGQEKFDEIMQQVATDIETKFPYGKLSKDETDEVRREELESVAFFVAKRDDGSYVLKSSEQIYEDTYMIDDFNLDACDAKSAEKALIPSVQEHYSQGEFWVTRELEGKQIKDLLGMSTRKLDLASRIKKLKSIGSDDRETAALFFDEAQQEFYYAEYNSPEIIESKKQALIKSTKEDWGIDDYVVPKSTLVRFETEDYSATMAGKDEEGNVFLKAGGGTRGHYGKMIEIAANLAEIKFFGDAPKIMVIHSKDLAVIDTGAKDGGEPSFAELTESERFSYKMAANGLSSYPIYSREVEEKEEPASFNKDAKDRQKPKSGFSAKGFLKRALGRVTTHEVEKPFFEENNKSKDKEEK